MKIKIKKSIQQKFFYEKIGDKILLQKQNNRSLQIRDLARSCVELKKRLKTMEKNQNKWLRSQLKYL